MRIINSILCSAAFMAFGFAQAQTLPSVIDRQVQGTNLHMNVNPMALEQTLDYGLQAIQDNAEGILRNSQTPMSVSYWGGVSSDTLTRGITMTDLSFTYTDSTYFFLDSLSTLSSSFPDWKSIGVVPGVYQVKTNIQVTTSDSPANPDTLYSFAGGAVSSERLAILFGGELPPLYDEFGPTLLIADLLSDLSVPQFLPADTSVSIQSSNVITVSDSAMISPLVLDDDFWYILPGPGAGGPGAGSPAPAPELELNMTKMTIVRLGDAVGFDKKWGYSND